MRKAVIKHADTGTGFMIRLFHLRRYRKSWFKHGKRRPTGRHIGHGIKSFGYLAMAFLPPTRKTDAMANHLDAEETAAENKSQGFKLMKYALSLHGSEALDAAMQRQGVF